MGTRGQAALRIVGTFEATASFHDIDGVFRVYSRYVASIALRLLGRDDEVDDIVQDVFIDAMRGLRELREPAAIRAWLATVTVRRTRRKLRLRRLRAFVGIDDAPDFEQLARSAGQGDALLIVRAYRVLEELPVDDKIAWMLRHVEGESLEDVARICGCSLATAKRRIARVQATLDVEIEP